MPLPKPVLDSRTFDQLVLEARGQLPRKAPAYTDYNYSDPGITAIDLFAWLAEQDFYRFDRVSPEMRRAFLRLAQVTVRPAQLATAVVLLTTTNASTVALPDRVQIATGGGVVFETDGALAVSPATLAAVDAAGTNVTAANAAPYQSTVDSVAGTFLPFGSSQPKPGAALTLGFNAPLGAAGARVSL